MPAEPKGTLEELLSQLGFDATVKAHQLEEGLLLDVHADDSGRLIGKKGQTLSALQFILNRLLFQQDPSAQKVTVDIDSYRSQAREKLIEQAMEAAEKVRRWGDVVEMDPMNAFDRRIVHNALKEDPSVETQSVEVEGSQLKAILLRPRH